MSAKEACICVGVAALRDMDNSGFIVEETLVPQSAVSLVPQSAMFLVHQLAAFGLRTFHSNVATASGAGTRRP